MDARPSRRRRVAGRLVAGLSVAAAGVVLTGGGGGIALGATATTAPATSTSRSPQLERFSTKARGGSRPVVKVPPAITGSAAVGALLSASTGTWSSTQQATYGYQWQRCNARGRSCAGVSGATKSSYAVAAADVGATLRVRVTATNSAGSSVASSAPTAIVAAADAASAPPAAGLLWRGDMETANLTQWSAGGGGGLFNSGIWTAAASTEQAHTGSYSLRAQISTPSSPTSGVRAFRWGEPRANRDAYYSAWFYFPVEYRLTGDPHTGQYWSLLQFKSRSADGTANDPMWAIELENASGGGLVPRIVWYGHIPGPHLGESGWRRYAPLVQGAIPAARWVHFEAFLHQSNSYDGRLTVWQDGTMIFDTSGVTTSYVNSDYNSWGADDEWSVNNYSDGVSPNPAFIYIDDAAVSTSYIP